MEARSVLEELLRTRPTESSPGRSLDDTVTLARATIPGCAGVGVVLWKAGGAVLAAAATSAAILRLDRSQLELSEGPFADMSTNRTAQVVPDLGAVARWARFAAQAAGLGLVGVLAVPLRAPPGTRGALSVYTENARALSPDALRMARIHAEQLSMMPNGAAAGRVLAEFLERRRDIGRAVGLLMESYHLTSQQGFDLLAEGGRSLGTGMHELAALLLRGGGTPVLRTPTRSELP